MISDEKVLTSINQMESTPEPGIGSTSFSKKSKYFQEVGITQSMEAGYMSTTIGHHQFRDLELAATETDNRMGDRQS